MGWDVGDATRDGDVLPDSSLRDGPLTDHSDASALDARDALGDCLDPTTDCTGELSAPVCAAHELTSYAWTCDETQRCVEEPRVEICSFGCAQAERGAVCARLAYTTGSDSTGDLCVVGAVDDDTPRCIDEAGHHIAWHPVRRDIIAYTTYDETAWVAVADLSEGMTSCQLRALDRNPPSFAAGAWRGDADDTLRLFEGEPEGGYSVSDWEYDAEVNEMCLRQAGTACTLVAGESYAELSGDLLIAGDSPGGGYAYLLRLGPDAHSGALSVLDVTGCTGDAIVEHVDVSAVAWRGEGQLTYIRAGSLYHLDLPDTNETLQIDAKDPAWSGGEFRLVAFNHDESILLARSTTASDDSVQLFTNVGDGPPIPWPDAGANTLPGPFGWVGLERF